MSIGLQPHVWLSGPDPVRHEQHIAWHRARAQAHYRGEEWELTYEQWIRIWGDKWSQRGRGVDNLLLTRKNYKKSWNTRNVHLVTRSEFHTHQWKIRKERAKEKNEHC